MGLRAPEFSIKIATVRETMNLNQTQFGDLLGVGRQNVSALERAAHEPSGPTRRLTDLLAILLERGYPVPHTEMLERHS